MVKTLALILKKQDLGETDRIITILTPAFGKKRIVARAVRKPLSKLAGHLDSLMVSQIIITDKPDLPSVTSAVLVESFENIRDSLELLTQTYAVGKVVERLAEEDAPQQSLFQSTVDAFSRIDENRNWPATWLFFLGQLSRYFGVNVTDFSCQKCGQPVTDDGIFNFEERAIFHLSHAPSDRSRRLGGNSIKLLKLLQGKPYEMIAKIRIPTDVATELEEVLLVELIENYGSAPWKKYACLAGDSYQTERK
jgi:DNA repair protein RecO (recombination protein O)